MSPYELLDLTLSLSNRIDTHWALFISVHLALIGGIIYVDRPLTKKEKTAAIIIYSGFAAINYFMMKGQAVFLNSIYQQIDSIKNDLCCKGDYVIAHVTNLYEVGISSALTISIIAVHVAMFIVMILSIFFDKKLPNQDKNNNTTD